MANWGTLLTINGQELGKVDITRGIFQGESFSPLLFVMAMITLTVMLRKIVKVLDLVALGKRLTT